MRRLDIHLKPSRIFSMLVGLIVFISLIICMSESMSIKLKFLLIPLICFYGASIIFRYGLLKHTKSITQLSLSENEWSVSDKIKNYSVELCGTSTVTKAICILRFKILGEKLKRSSVILPDSISKDSYRKLLMNIKN